MSTRLFMSSGDLVADRRYDFARDLQLRGDLEGAADVMMQAVELAPGFASAWFALGEIKQRLNLHGDAIAAFRQAVAADPDDRHGAGLRLIRLGEEPTSPMSPAYVRTLFDQYAPRFEASLVGNLGYRGPDLLFKAVLAARHAEHRPAFFHHGIDLGCGTGLVARTFARNVERLDGIDLSSRMLALARTAGLYKELELADMVQGLAGKAPASADLILVADAVIYLVDLAPLLHQAARVLQPGGLLAFTAETHGGEGVVLGAGLRYAHSAAYVRAAIATAGLRLSQLSEASARTEDGVAVPGLVVVAMKQ
ncbi:MAG TPA: methyltransferase domain-containing protein [Xanthobacteraceae bacterium]|jgi:predicted TPR repeat methyltransferase